MAWPSNTAEVLDYLGVDVGDSPPSVVVGAGRGGVVVTWNGHAPIEESVVTNAAASPGFAAWREEHGGDAVKTRRREAKEHLRAALKDAQLTRAQFAVVVDEFNRHTLRYDSLRTAVIALASAISTGANLAAIKAAINLIGPPMSALAERTDEDLMRAADNVLNTNRVD